MLDNIEATSQCLWLYEIRAEQPEMPEMAANLLAATEALKRAVGSLSTRIDAERTRELCAAVKQVEKGLLGVQRAHHGARRKRGTVGERATAPGARPGSPTAPRSARPGAPPAPPPPGRGPGGGGRGAPPGPHPGGSGGGRGSPGRSTGGGGGPPRGTPAAPMTALPSW